MLSFNAVLHFLTNVPGSLLFAGLIGLLVGCGFVGLYYSERVKHTLASVGRTMPGMLRISLLLGRAFVGLGCLLLIGMFVAAWSEAGIGSIGTMLLVLAISAVVAVIIFLPGWAMSRKVRRLIS